MAGLTIGKFAADGGVSVETVRFYQRRGLLSLPERRGSGFREYTEADQWRLAFIRRAQQLGFTLAEIRDLLADTNKRRWRRFVDEKLEEVDRTIAQAQAMRGILRLSRDCDCVDVTECAKRCS